jgi:hypothetical protein
MPFRFLLASLTLLFLVSRTGAQESKTFSDDKCSYTLPDDDWEAAALAKAINCFYLA